MSISIIHGYLEEGAIETDKLAEDQTREETSDMVPDVGGEDRDGHVEGGKNKLRMACRLEKDFGENSVNPCQVADDRWLLDVSPCSHLTLITYVK